MSKSLILNDIPALEQALSTAGSNPVLIFKHSATCPVSARAHQAVDNFLASEASREVPVYTVVVQQARDVSEAVATKTGVRHESPQILMMREGQCIWSTSHRNITMEALCDAIAKN